MPADYRARLGAETAMKVEEHGMSVSDQFAKLLADVEPEDDEDDVESYDFREVSKWLPLVYYD